jgi:hypothetical protein
MKKNPTVFGLIITLGIVLVCYLIYALFLNKKDSYLIANPSDKSLEIKIDGQAFILAPNQTTNIDLTPGKHTLHFDWEGKTIDTLFDVNYHNGLINPTQAEFFIFTRPYGPGRNKDSLFTSQSMTIDEKVFFGNIQQSNDLYIQGFYYNLDQDYPKVFMKKGEHVDVSKIFSKDDFKQFYFENYE